MTRARNGAAPAAPVLAPVWHTLPRDEDGPVSRPAPKCQDGDELLARMESGEVIEITIERDNKGWRWLGPDGEPIDVHAVEAIAERPRPSRSGATQPEAERLKAGRTRINLSLTLEQKRRLEWIRDEDGHDFATIVGCAIDAEYEERNPGKVMAGGK